MKRRDFVAAAASLVAARGVRIHSGDILTPADREWICEHASEFAATAKSPLVREQARIILLYEDQLRLALAGGPDGA